MRVLTEESEWEDMIYVPQNGDPATAESIVGNGEAPYNVGVQANANRTRFLLNNAANGLLTGADVECFGDQYLRVSAGSVVINGRHYTVPATVVEATGLAINEWRYLYVYPTTLAGPVAFEVSTTPPWHPSADPKRATAWKNGDSATNRRYICAARTRTVSTAFYRFIKTGRSYRYRPEDASSDGNQTAFRVWDASTSGSWGAVLNVPRVAHADGSQPPLVPPHVRKLHLRAEVNDARDSETVDQARKIAFIRTDSTDATTAGVAVVAYTDVGQRIAIPHLELICTETDKQFEVQTQHAEIAITVWTLGFEE
jgi:hypothetical protein